jgi:pentalenene oxygenase
MADRPVYSWKVAEAPGALPVLGHAWKLRKGLLPFLQSLPEHGDLVRIRIGTWHGYVACHPDLVHTILLDDRTYDRGGRFYDTAREFIGNGLASCPRRDHRRQRRLMQPAFHHTRVVEYSQVMTAQIEALLGGWETASVIDIPVQMHHLTSQVIARTLFSGEAADHASAVAAECVPDLASGVYWGTALPKWMRRFTSHQHRFTRARKRVQEAVAEAIRAHRRSPGTQHDLLAILMTARGEHDEPLSDREILIARTYIPTPNDSLRTAGTSSAPALSPGTHSCPSATAPADASVTPTPLPSPTWHWRASPPDGT